MKGRVIQSKFWSDKWVLTLTAEEKLAYLYLLLNESLNVLSLFELSEELMSFETKIKKEEISRMLNMFQQAGKIDYFNGYILLKNASKYQNYSGVKNYQGKVRIILEMNSEVAKYHSSHIKEEVLTIVKGFRNISKAFDGKDKLERDLKIIIKNFNLPSNILEGSIEPSKNQNTNNINQNKETSKEKTNCVNNKNESEYQKQDKESGGYMKARNKADEIRESYPNEKYVGK